MDYLYIKSLHLIFVVTWFAGLFYIVRLFIYQTEAKDKEPHEKEVLIPQFKVMQSRLWYGITWPSAILASFFAFWLLYEQASWLAMPWMHLKLGFVLGLYVYFAWCQRTYNQLKKDVYKYSSLQLRIWNEGATVFLVAIVFIVILKDTLSWIWGLFGIVVFALMLMLGIRLYKNFREKKAQQNTESLETDESNS